MVRSGAGAPVTKKDRVSAGERLLKDGPQNHGRGWGGRGPTRAIRRGEGTGPPPDLQTGRGTSERSERGRASGASEQRTLQIHSFSVWLKQIALKTVYCRFSAAYTWFLVAIQTPVLPHWQPALCYRRKVYIHRTECSYLLCPQLITFSKVEWKYKIGTQITNTFQS